MKPEDPRSEKLTCKLIDKLEKEHDLTEKEMSALLLDKDPETDRYLARKALEVRDRIYGRCVYLRGLIEFTNYCKNNCYYCGIRRDNGNAQRYRLEKEEILDCCRQGYALGFRTFVLQGGEDPYFTDDRIVSIVSGIKECFPDVAVTLSVGERKKESYQRFFDAGADRYLLRHETADPDHYRFLHPEEMDFDHRIRCLEDLRSIGYQVGCGMMVGSPGQKTEHLLRDLRLIQSFRPHMVGIGPFIPHKDTMYAGQEPGSVALTLRLLSIIRLMLPEVLLPATTALGTLDPRGREKGLMAGANVLMPNLSPSEVRGKYLLYDNKICTGDEAAECVRCLSFRVEKAGCKVVVSRGDHKRFQNESDE
ncbi:MAG: [FeFe] hydrogenase H-cluster radical SAM maturase HydE [Lachnospiraceae bacterium]|nr:[FeFe] hydrogenase H-cluster radical SAM maturase HydE [Lachnospiraceae bacterium]